MLRPLQAEVDALNQSMQDSGKALQEKFALTRELGRLKPELEHLQSQLTNHQAVVAEKNDLRHQLDSLEVEIENERRSRQRLQSKKESDVVNDLQTRLDNAERRLSTEKKDQQKSKKESDKEIKDLNTRNKRLEESLSKLQTSLQQTEGGRRDLQTELGDLRAQNRSDVKAPAPVARSRKSSSFAEQPAQKRRIEDISMEEMTVETPGNETGRSRQPAKKPGVTKAQLGQKSEFSITPFLKKSKKISFESPEPPDSRPPHDEGDEILANTSGEPVDEHLESSNDQLEAAPAYEPLGSEGDPLDDVDEDVPQQIGTSQEGTSRGKESGVSKAQSKPRGRPKAKPTVLAGDPKVVDALMDEQPVLSQAKRKPKGPGLTSRQPVIAKPEQPRLSDSREDSVLTTASNAELKRKKRKLMGAPRNTLFDDDDDEATTRPAKMSTGGIRRMKPTFGGRFGGSLAGGTTFSPLKRDKRGVNASFLG